jgi:hypothetical protein
VGWGTGRDSTSSAQSKRGGAGIEHSSVVLGGGSTIDGGRRTTVAVGSDVPAVVEGAEWVETARLRSSWGKVGGWEAFRGCSNGSSSVFRRFRAAAGGSEWGGAWENTVVVDTRVNDVAGGKNA